MTYRILKGIVSKSTLVVTVVLLLAAPSFAATVNLVAKKFTTLMPDGATINMWGFATDIGQACTESPGWAVGPTLPVTAPDTSLTINLRNCLDEPVSIVIPGQTAVYQTPATFTDSQGRVRIKSFTAETAAAGGTGSYTWNNLKPGTFLYQSGSHSAVQVQMGLYGPLKVYPATAGRAYDDASTAYTTEVTLLYSEIDKGLHDAVATGAYGTPPGPTSTLDYQADYFLINGQPFQDGVTLPVAAGDDTHTTLIRFLNAGLRSHVPTLLGSYLKLIAEDGNLYPYTREQYSVLLAAGKTIDALWTPTCADTYKLYDRSLHLTTGGQPGGGMLAYLDITGTACFVPPVPPAPPVALDADYAVNEDASAAITLAASDVNGDTLSYSIVTPPSHGGLTGVAPNLTYTPATDYNGPDSFTFKANDGSSGDSNVATVSITVNPVNDAPSFTAGPNQTVTLPLAAQTVLNWATNIRRGPPTATDESGQTVSFFLSNNNNALFSAQPAVSPTGTLTYTPSGTTGSATVTVWVQDNGGTANGGVDTSGAQTFTITINPPPLSVHVGGLTGAITGFYPLLWRFVVTVTVHNQSESLMSGATVTGTWSAGDTNNVQLSCTTGTNGQCTVQSGRISTRSVTFTVTNVTAAGATYQPSANHNPGTSITNP